MKPESALYLEKARQSVKEARAIAAIGLAEAVGRAAYMAMFHAAQAVIFELGGKVAKTHRGVHAQFARLTREDPTLARSCPATYHELMILKRSRIMRLDQTQRYRLQMPSPLRKSLKTLWFRSPPRSRQIHSPNPETPAWGLGN